MNEQLKVTRRALLYRAVVLSGGLATASLLTACGGGAAPPAAAPTTAPSAPTSAPAAAPTSAAAAKPGAANLSFMVWSYSIETIQDNIKNFQQLNPGATVKLQDFSWLDYHDVMAARFVGGNAPDVAYSSDHWLQEWVAANWIVPLDDVHPAFKDYTKEFAPYALQAMTLNGKLYGLPYYSDLLIYMYNADHLQKAGFSAAPQTWDEVKQQAQVIKDKGIAEFPINIPFKKDDPWSIEIFYSMVYGQGGRMFDDKAEPVFNKPGSEAEQTLQWIHDAMNTWKVMNPAALEVAEPDVVKALGAGQSSATVLAKYNLAAVNTGDSPQKGKFKMALMPGKSHSTVGFARFYALTKKAVDRGKNVEQTAVSFLDYFGGKTDNKYVVQKRWAVEKGLGFAVLPLYDDADVAASINQWGDVNLEKEQAKLARVKEGLTPWWGTWDIFAREQLHNAITGTAKPAESLKAMADKWQDLKTAYTA
jgi:multiple sugar transport system substrate-binding protein